LRKVCPPYINLSVFSFPFSNCREVILNRDKTNRDTEGDDAAMIPHGDLSLPTGRYTRAWTDEATVWASSSEFSTAGKDQLS
jgi:hypothetical protein